jgi:LmbE family N-acetylglucosaminyl deacetylase
MKFDNYSRVLVISAHPDDEVLGCGGLMSRLAKHGIQVTSIFLADGVSSRHDYLHKESWSDELMERRRACVKAAEILGSQQPIFYDFPDNQLDQVPILQLARAIEKHINTLSPDLILTHFPGDLNIDHRRVSEAVITAARPGTRNNPSEIWAFEVLSSTEWNATPNSYFKPDIFVDITDQVSSKLNALQAYNYEMREFPHPRSEKAIRALLEWRGSNSGLLNAEAFIQLRRIIG